MPTEPAAHIALDTSTSQHGNRTGWRRFTGMAIVLSAAALAVAPQLIRGNSCGHDFNVHLVSWLDCVHAWRHGIAYPHWTPSPNYGAGEPRFVFYPPLTWMAGAALGCLLPWWLAPIAFTFLCLAGTGLATRALALEALDDARATVAGCAAIFSGFALFTAYERSAFPEFMGGVWLPLLVLFALRDRRATEVPCPVLSLSLGRKGGKPRNPFAFASFPAFRRAFDGSTVPLALVLAVSWLSNAPLGVIASYLLAGVALIAALTGRSWAPLLRAAVAAALGLGAIAFYWIPAWYEQRWVDIRQATEDPGYNFENNWAFAHHADPLLAVHDQVLRQASWIAVSMIAVALAALVVCWRRKTLPAGKATGFRLWWMALAAIPVVSLFLLFPISRPLWRLLPEFRFLQYPWRWMEAVEAPMAIFFAAAIWPRRRWARTLAGAACAAGCFAATVYAATAFFQVCYPEDTVASTLTSYRTGAGFEGMYEYEPPGSDLTLIATGLPAACLVHDPGTALGQPDSGNENPAWNAGQGTCKATLADSQDENPERLRMRGVMPEPGYLVLRLLSYPAWQVRVNGAPPASLPRREDGLVAVPVPKGPVSVTVDWTTTADVKASRWLSLLGLLALAGVALLERKTTRTQVS